MSSKNSGIALPPIVFGSITILPSAATAPGIENISNILCSATVLLSTNFLGLLFFFLNLLAIYSLVYPDPIRSEFVLTIFLVNGLLLSARSFFLIRASDELSLVKK
jgi:hypothetical protein